MAYDWLTFGVAINLGYTNLHERGLRPGDRQGIVGVTWPWFGVLVDLLIGTRGLAALRAMVRLAPLGLLALRRRDLRREIAACVAVVVRLPSSSTPGTTSRSVAGRPARAS